MDYNVENLQESTFAVTRWMVELLRNWGVSERFADTVLMVVQLATVVLFTYIFQWVAKRIIIFILDRLGRGKKLKIANHLVTNKFPVYLALFVPLTWLLNTIPVVFEKFAHIEAGALKIVQLIIVVVIFKMIMSILGAVTDYLLTREKYKDKPIESYLQVFRIILVIFTVAAVIAIFTSITMGRFFTSMGAASAVMMLIFKDSILGLVASIQVTTNDMVRKGDWITMPKYNADGDVQRITLNTVKVVNFDKTIITIPTYALVSESFQNWRGMQDAGGRRIKRTINIKQGSVKYVEREDLPKYREIQFLKDYIPERQAEIDAHNERIGANRKFAVNGRNLTNIGLYRQYALMYLKSLDTIKQDMSIMVRQLAPDSHGLPLEVYCFTNTTIWARYEDIMADVFDHLIAALSYFDLEVFEESSSNDKILVESIKA